MTYNMFTKDNIMHHLKDNPLNFTDFKLIAAYLIEIDCEDIDIWQQIINNANDFLDLANFIARCFGYVIVTSELEEYLTAFSVMIHMFEIQTKLDDLEVKLTEGEYHFQIGKN